MDKKRQVKAPIFKYVFTIIFILMVLSVVVYQLSVAFSSTLPVDSSAIPTALPGSIMSSPSGVPSTSSVSSPIPGLAAKATLTAVGDIILHQAVIDGGLQKNGEYQFNKMFQYVAPYLKKSDYSIANYEGALNGPPYTGYPTFWGPDAIANALKNAGIDMVTTANNHAFDRGLSGLERTPTVFTKLGLKVIGTRAKPQDLNFQIVNVNGIRIGFIGYTFETTGTGKNKALNGVNMPAEANKLIDSFNPYRDSRYKENMKEMANRIKAMKDAKAECIVFQLHWGEEYKTVSNTTQRTLAKFLSDQGVDIIFGHHPHVLQEIDVVHSSVSGKNTLVYYSIGNFLHNMEYITHDTKGFAEDAIIAQVEITRNNDGKIQITKGEYIKTYVYKNITSGKVKHQIIPVKEALANPSYYGMTGQTGILKKSSARINEVLSSSVGKKFGILVKEKISS